MAARRWLLFGLALLAGCTKPSEDEFVGTASMGPDNSIILDIASKQENGAIAHGHFVYPPGHPRYREILEHVGSIKPGETKPVRPW